METGAAGSNRAENNDVVRVMLFSDLHIDRPYLWATPDVSAGRRIASKEVLVAILAEARRRSADVIACAGDLFDRNAVQPASVRWLIAAFRSASVPVLISPGNEDWIGPLGGYTRHKWPANVTVFDSDEPTPCEIADGVTVWGAAHRQAHRNASFLDGFRVDRSGVNIALFHGTEANAREREPELDACASFSEADIEHAGLDHALVGHCQTRHFGRVHTYPGAPLAHDFGASPTGGTVSITVTEGGTIDREFIPIPSPGLHDLAVDVTGASSAAEVVDRARGAISGLSGIARLHLKGRLSPDVVITAEEFAQLKGRLDHMTMEWEVDADLDLEALADEHTVRGEFVRDVLSSPSLSDDRRRRVLLIGLRALAGHDDLDAPR